jgi:uncharacterized membrane protein (DUF2068 family)
MPEGMQKLQRQRTHTFYYLKEDRKMACFVVPAAEAVIVKAIEKTVVKDTSDSKQGISMSRKLKWLSGLLIGGAVLLAFEHVWHGEVVPWFPFLTAMYNPADKAEMLHEMATVGTSMAVLITAVWGVMCLAADAIVKRAPKKAEAN